MPGLSQDSDDIFFLENRGLIIGSIVTVLLLGLAVVVFQAKKSMDQNQKVQIQKEINRNQSLHIKKLNEQMTMLQDYKEKEKDMIQAQIDKFKEEYTQAKKEKPLDAFLIYADEIKPEQQLGKGGEKWRGAKRRAVRSHLWRIDV